MFINFDFPLFLRFAAGTFFSSLQTFPRSPESWQIQVPVLVLVLVSSLSRV